MTRENLYFWLGAEAEPKNRITCRDVQATVSAYYQVPLTMMTGRNKAKDAVIPRQMAMYLARQVTGQSFPELGRRFGDRDHTTIMHGFHASAHRIKHNPEYTRDAIKLMERLVG